jgi:glucose/arabinose dehydrogenase
MDNLRLAAIAPLAFAFSTFAQTCPSIETRSPEGRDQKPAFAGQTRACAVKGNVAFDVTVVAKGLQNPWAVEPMPNGDLLVTERPGRMRIVSASGEVREPIAGLPRIEARGQGGLLDVALSPKFESDRTLYWAFTEPREGGNATSVARGVLSQDGKSVGDVRVIFQALPTYAGTHHFGSRLAFGPDGMLYVTTGDRSDRAMRPHAQRWDGHMGKTLRITTDGKPAPGNPFLGQADRKPEIWSTGHRNIQSAAFDAQGRYWTVEHGARGGDELNLIEKGKNYGWPIQTFGLEYSGAPIADSKTDVPGMERPVYYWDPVIAPSGAQFHSGNGFPAWKGNLFIGGLRAGALVRLVIEGNRVTGEEHLLGDRKQRVRDVREGRDGSLYVVTDEANGELWRISPKR